MRDAEEIDIKRLKSFATQVRLPFIKVTFNTGLITFSTAVIKEADIHDGDRIKLSRSSNGSIYLYRETRHSAGGVKVNLYKRVYRISSRQMTDVIFEAFHLDKGFSHRIYIDILGEPLMLKRIEGKETVVKGFRLIKIEGLDHAT